MVVPLVGYVKKIGMLPTGIFIFFITLMLILGSDYIYGTFGGQMKDMLYVYLFMLFGAMAMIPVIKPIKAIPLSRGIASFAIMFMATFIITLTLSGLIATFIQVSTLEVGIALIATFGLLHAFIKAFIEEKVFREIISRKIGKIPSSIIFGLFHFFVLIGVLGFSWPLFLALAWLSALGYIWCIVYERFGLMGSTGSHFGYNVVAMGMAPAILGVVI